MKSPFLVGIPGAELTHDDTQRLERIRPLGVILFARNYRNPEQLGRLTASIRNLLGVDAVIAVDHEGGRVVHFGDAVPPMPAASQLGIDGNPEQVRMLAAQAGRVLRQLGITMNLAPVVDVRTPSTNASMAERCYSADPAVVGVMAAAFITGMHDAGVQCTAKHFPGIGPVVDDTHDQASLVTTSRPELKRLWTPFRAAMDAGVDAVMLTHATYQKLDPHNPATGSSKIILGILRDQCQFKGKVISDDLEMGAIGRHYSIEEITEKSLRAGVDIALLCHKPELQDRAHRAWAKMTS